MRHSGEIYKTSVEIELSSEMATPLAGCKTLDCLGNLLVYYFFLLKKILTYLSHGIVLGTVLVRIL